MTEFKLTRQETTLEFDLQTTDTVTTYSGTPFPPNHCTARVHGAVISSVVLEQLTEGGWAIDDPAGPDGAELTASYGGGEFLPENVDKLPEVARVALREVRRLIG